MSQIKCSKTTLVIIVLFTILNSYFLSNHVTVVLDLNGTDSASRHSEVKNNRSEVKEIKSSIMVNAPVPNQTTIEVLRRIPDSYYDYNRSSMDLFTSDKDCNMLDVKFGKNLPFVYLLSFPRSGNTWARYLIEAATGIFTGSVYTSRFLTEIGYFGEKENPVKGTVIMVKTHRDYNVIRPNEPKIYNNSLPVVAIIRNPERCIISLVNYAETKGSFARSLNFLYNETKDYKSYVLRELKIWLNMYTNCLKYSSNLLVIFYENLVKNPLEEVEKIVNFLGYKIDPKRFKCLAKHSQGPVKRKHSQEEMKVFQNEEVKGQYESAVLQILSLLESRGIEAPKEYKDYVNHNV